VTEISNIPFCSFVYVEPASIDDWEILVSTNKYYTHNYQVCITAVIVGHYTVCSINRNTYI